MNLINYFYVINFILYSLDIIFDNYIKLRDFLNYREFVILLGINRGNNFK